MNAPRLAALLGLLALGCAGADVAPPSVFRAPTTGRVARVEVSFSAPDATGLARAEAGRTAAVVRQSARDWLEHGQRLAADGPLALEVSLDSLCLRSSLVTWLFSWAAAPDHLAARVVVRRRGTRVAAFPLRVESALAGFAWRDPEARLERLARRLGHRVAAEL